MRVSTSSARFNGFLFLLAVAHFITYNVIFVRAAEAQEPLKAGDRDKYEAACPDYSQYSKYALQ